MLESRELTRAGEMVVKMMELFVGEKKSTCLFACVLAANAMAKSAGGAAAHVKQVLDYIEGNHV